VEAIVISPRHSRAKGENELLWAEGHMKFIVHLCLEGLWLKNLPCSLPNSTAVLRILPLLAFTELGKHMCHTPAGSLSPLRFS
jgi:hypothetical protein